MSSPPFACEASFYMHTCMLAVIHVITTCTSLDSSLKIPDLRPYALRRLDPMFKERRGQKQYKTSGATTIACL